MHGFLRDHARALRGPEVVVLTEAVVATDGAIADLQALEIRAATAQAADDTNTVSH